MLDVEEIRNAATQLTGLSKVSDDAVYVGLNTFVDSLNAEAPLNEGGWERVRGVLVNTLANRLRVDDYLAHHPELLERPVEKPLFVFGLPRTGTTLTINLLNADPARRSLLRWEALNSVPPPRAGEFSTDPRCAESQVAIDLSLKYTPHISAIHHEDADSPTECQFAMSQSFCAQYLEAIVEVPSYRRWFLNTSYLPAFRYHKRLLQLLQAEAPGRWTLKNPWHPLFLEDLVSVYPDAQLVMTHRDPADVVGSACSLIKHVRALFSDRVDTGYIGESMVDTFEEMIRRALAYKERHGWDSIYDIQYAVLLADPVAEIRKIYQRFDEPWTDAAETAMNSYMADNAQGKHGEHVYSLEEFGLDRETVHERFADYIRAFDIPLRD
jgi:hypothetical protein